MAVKYEMSLWKTRFRGKKRKVSKVNWWVTLMGFDDYVNMVLEDVVEYEQTPDGKRVTKLDTILLNGNHITMLVPGGEGPEV
ncbi:LSM domain protein [Ancylostoma ceylanicum]|uniref:U6 snRNA-associated Sm-like protein LSm5 n=1 Tax=Ancylostoma ceylanicum TaxID=53326 RepID=A0A0D6LT62_9BILA|nr:LSM domain protein [Ancylostoma ceylanicum]